MVKTIPLLLTLISALTLAGCQQSNDVAFGKHVREYLLAHPEVLDEAMQKLAENKRTAQLNLAKASLKTHRQALEADARDFVANPNGTFTVVEFFDYRCGYCKSSAPIMLELIKNNPDVRFVFKELPIFGGPSNLAAGVALTPAGKAKGLELYQAFMSDKVLDEEGIARHLRSLGIDPAEAKALSDTPGVQKQISDTHALAASLGIEGTPAFIIGDELIPGADMDGLKAAVAGIRGDKTKRPS